MGVADPVRSALRDLARLVVPVECPGCGRFDALLCRGCARHLDGAPRRCDAGAPRLDRVAEATRLPVWCVADYAGPVRDVVLAWKDHGRADLSRFLEPAIERAAHRLAPVLAAGLAADGLPAPPARGGPPGVLLVVPAPSSAAARRRRGADLVGGLAAGVASGLRVGGVPARSAALLRPARRTRDQVGLGVRARGGVTVRPRRGAGPLAPGQPCLLVDDVLTTGATLAACGDTLTRQGAVVVGAVVLAATPPPAPRPRGFTRTESDTADPPLSGGGVPD